jgi:hypothetical protein
MSMGDRHWYDACIYLHELSIKFVYVEDRVF